MAPAVSVRSGRAHHTATRQRRPSTHFSGGLEHYLHIVPGNLGQSQHGLPSLDDSPPQRSACSASSTHVIGERTREQRVRADKPLCGVPDRPSKLENRHRTDKSPRRAADCPREHAFVGRCRRTKPAKAMARSPRPQRAENGRLDRLDEVVGEYELVAVPGDQPVIAGVDEHVTRSHLRRKHPWV